MTTQRSAASYPLRNLITRDEPLCGLAFMALATALTRARWHRAA